MFKLMDNHREKKIKDRHKQKKIALLLRQYLCKDVVDEIGEPKITLTQ